MNKKLMTSALVAGTLGLAASANAATTFTTDIVGALSTNYGVDTVATFTSPSVLAEDGFATFNITFDITPTTGTEIATNASGYWAVDNTNFNNTEAVDSIGNITVTNFNSNGGTMTVADVSGLSFGAVYYQGATGGSDAGFITAGVNTGNWTNMGTVPQFDGHTSSKADTQVLAGGAGTIVPSIVLGATGTSTSWRINRIEVVGVTTAVPEPSSTALLGLAGLALILRRRK